MAINASHHHPHETARRVGERIGWFSSPAMRYPGEYVWLVFLSAMDVIFTALILVLGGSEVNPIAMGIIENWGMGGAMAFKFALTLLAIIMCELVGRSGDAKGQRLARVLVAMAAFPVVWSFVLLASAGPTHVMEAVIQTLSAG